MGGYISPSHDFYVGPKSKSHRTSFANASHRVAMAELAVQAHDWLAIAKWESRHPNRWPDFTEVAQELSKHLTKEPPLTVFFVCGSDHANKCGLDHWGAKGLGLVVVARDGVAVTNKTKAEKHVFWCTNEGPLKTSSSTKVRQAIEQNDAPALNALMNPHVFQYMQQHQLYGTELLPETKESKGEATVQKGVTHGEEIILPLPTAALSSTATATPASTASTTTATTASSSSTASTTTTTTTTNNTDKATTDQHHEEEDDDFSLDISDAIDGLHASWIEEGHKEAVSGLEGTDIEAMKLGIHHGTQLGYELGYMKGVLDILSSSSAPQFSQRCLATIKSVTMQLVSFSIAPTSDQFQVSLDRIRADFRKCCSQSKLKGVHNNWKVTSLNNRSEVRSVGF